MVYVVNKIGFKNRIHIIVSVNIKVSVELLFFNQKLNENFGQKHFKCTIMAGQDNPLEIMDEPSSVKPGGSKEPDNSKHFHKGLFGPTDDLVSLLYTRHLLTCGV